MSATLSVHKITVLGAAFLTACGFLYSISSLYQGSRPVVQAPTYHKVERPTIRDTFYRMFEAIKLPPTADSYTDPWGQVFEIKEDGPYWTEPLGREVLIVDIDTRIPNGSNELWDKGRMNWDTLKNEGDGGMISASQMNHFLYAQIHGYDYRFYHANDMDGLHNTWVKPHALLDLIPSYKFVVFLDADATVQHFEVPIEWLLNRWGITPDTSIAMAQDVMQQMGDNDHIGVDDRGNMEHNTGVAIVQNIPYTIKMLTDWRDCPNSNDTHFDGCGRWAEEWAHEQRAFNEYIRYYYNPNGTNIVTIPCDDAMGFPGLGDFGHIASNCTGQFFRHHTIAKDRTKRSTEIAMLQAITDLARKELMRNQDAYYLPETDIRRVEDSTTDVEDVNHD